RIYGSGGWGFYSLSGGNYTSPAGDKGTLATSRSGLQYTTPDGRKWNFDSNGNETSQVSGDGLNTITYAYNGQKYLATLTAPDGALATFSYNGSNQVTKIAAAGGRTYTLTYDASSNLSTVTDPDAGIRTFTYDTSHHLTSDSFATLRSSYAYSSGALSSK